MDATLPKAIAILKSAEEKNLAVYLRGCVNYICRMKPDEIEVDDE